METADRFKAMFGIQKTPTGKSEAFQRGWHCGLRHDGSIDDCPFNKKETLLSEDWLKGFIAGGEIAIRQSQNDKMQTTKPAPDGSH